MWMGAEALLMFQKVVIIFVRIMTKFIVPVSVIWWSKSNILVVVEFFHIDILSVQLYQFPLFSNGGNATAWGHHYAKRYRWGWHSIHFLFHFLFNFRCFLSHIGALIGALCCLSCSHACDNTIQWSYLHLSLCCADSAYKGSHYSEKSSWAVKPSCASWSASVEYCSSLASPGSFSFSPLSLVS